MKKKIVMCLLVAVISVVGLSRCSSKEQEEYKDVVTEFLTSYQEQDASCGNYLVKSEEDMSVSFKGFQGILANSITFEIESVESEDDYMIVNTTITNVDFGVIFEKLVHSENLQVGTKEEILEELKKRIQKEDADRRSFEVPIQVNKEQKIQMTSELSNALLGGYTQYIYELTVGEKIENEK